MRRRYFTRSGRRSVGRRIVLGVLATVVVLAAVIAGAMALRGPEIAGRVLAAAADQAGLGPLRLDVRSIGFAGMTLGEIRLGDADGPAASAAEIGWTPLGLLHGRLRSVRVVGFTLNARIENGSVVIAGLPRGEAGGGIPALPAERLELSRAKVVLATGTTRIDATVDATLAPADSGLAGTADIDLMATAGRAEPIRAAIKLPTWRATDLANGLTLAIAGAEVLLPQYEALLANVDAEMRAGTALSAKLSGRLHDRASPARIVLPLAITAEAEEGAPQQIVFRGRAATAQGELAATFDGRHDLGKAAGTIAFDVAPIRFAAGGLQPAALFPMVGDAVRNVSGDISGRGSLSWRTGLTSHGTLSLDRVGLTASLARVSALTGTVQLVSLMPPRTAPAQHITANVDVVGLPTMPLDLRFALPAADRLDIDSATLGFADGILGLANVTIARDKPLDAELTIRDVNLGALLKLLDVEGLSGSGAIDGSVPLRIDQGGVALDSADLVGTAPGVLRYTGSALPEPAADAPATDPVRLMRAALADFHYTGLKLTLERGTGGEGSLLVNLKGANPRVLDNHPFVFNIRLDANFDRLADILFEGYNAAEALMRRGTPP
jgi:hypothetical protein